MAEIPTARTHEIRSIAEKLWVDRIPLIGGDPDLDVEEVAIELCRNGRYGFYHRYNPDPQKQVDADVMKLAELIMATASKPANKPQ